MTSMGRGPLDSAIRGSAATPAPPLFLQTDNSPPEGTLPWGTCGVSSHIEAICMLGLQVPCLCVSGALRAATRRRWNVTRCA
ncbi:MAG: hypothetical protein EOO65_05300 [Methanosarcinales archaeon]|nr:MAG: hypothetical protein EOO65_05300 [Methanosarcinales archaeon]